MLEPASLFTDGAVLCRDKEIRVFGRADNGETVTARLEDSHDSVLAAAGSDGMPARAALQNGTDRGAGCRDRRRFPGRRTEQYGA